LRHKSLDRRRFKLLNFLNSANPVSFTGFPALLGFTGFPRIFGFPGFFRLLLQCHCRLFPLQALSGP
jgi:hypothetical protein